jgi:hypothetical protein
MSMASLRWFCNVQTYDGIVTKFECFSTENLIRINI